MREFISNSSMSLMHLFIPTPAISMVGVGPFSIHFYALCILLGVLSVLWLGGRRYQTLGGERADLSQVALLAIPAGIIGGRLYHVITSPDRYFGAGGDPWRAFAIWEGGLGIWGAIALGTLVAYLVFKRGARSTSFAIFADALAPTLLIAQGIGRFGNWFNGELYGKPTTRPWGLSIPLADRVPGYERFSTFQPTFAFEALWCFFSAVIIFQWGSRWKRRDGEIFLFYILFYTFGRFWMELLRIDNSHRFLGARLNLWVDLTVALAALALLVWGRMSAKNQREAVR
jgi:prolipoprotein diacylglyceryl transferase